MEYKNIKFEAIVATPACGKSYLCDKYPNTFVDVDEERLKCKYFIPENITRKELEETKGNRLFARRTKDYRKTLCQKLDTYLKQGKILIAAPHEESINYLIERGIKFCFVFPNIKMQKEIERRMIDRGNPSSFSKENSDLFFKFYESNLNESRAAVKYEFGENEYLEDILKKFNCKF